MNGRQRGTSTQSGPYRRLQLVGCLGIEDYVIDPCGGYPLTGWGVHRSGIEHDREARPYPPEPLTQLKARQLGHVKVKDGEIEFIGLIGKGPQGVQALALTAHPVAEPFDHDGEWNEQRLVIVDEQDMERSRRAHEGALSLSLGPWPRSLQAEDGAARAPGKALRGRAQRPDGHSIIMNPRSQSAKNGTAAQREEARSGTRNQGVHGKFFLTFCMALYNIKRIRKRETILEV